MAKFELKKMDPKAKRTWLRALRSGKYRPARGTLHNEASNGFCCLGVAKHCIDGKTSDSSYLRDGAYGLQMRVQLALSSANDCSGAIGAFKNIGLPPPKLDKSGRGSSFKAIADWIEKYL